MSKRVEVLKLANIFVVECMATQKAYCMSKEYTLPLFLPNFMEKAIKVLSYKNALMDSIYETLHIIRERARDGDTWRSKEEQSSHVIRRYVCILKALESESRSIFKNMRTIFSLFMFPYLYL